MSFSDVTHPSANWRRAAMLALVALALAAVATSAVVSRAGAATTSIVVNPNNTTRTVGSVHAMGVTVTPIEGGVLVRYQILSGPNSGDTGAATTSSSGGVVFSYTGDGGAGTDAILIWADLDLDNLRDSGEPQTAAIVEWLSDPVSGISLAPSGSSGVVNSSHTVTATVSPAQNGVIVRFRVATGPNAGDTGVSVTNLSGQAAFTYIGNGGAGTDAIIAWADFDNDAVRDSNEPQTAATRLWTSGPIGGVTVSPATAIVELDGLHSLHATILPAQPNLMMRFEVTSGPNAGKRGVALTDAGGRASYSYVGGGGAGLDTILSWLDLDNDSSADANEPRGQATALWGTAPSPTLSIIATPLTDSGLTGSLHTVTATVSPTQAGYVVRFRVLAGPHAGVNKRALTNSSGQATLTYLGSVAGADSIAAWIDLDDDGVIDSVEPRAFAAISWIASSQPQSIALTPTSNVSLIGTTHSVTSTVSPAQSGVIVRFAVTVGPNHGRTSVAATNSLGRATFSYVGNGGGGADAIVSWVDLNNNGSRGTNEPQASAIQNWVSAQASGITVTAATSSGQLNTQHTVSALVSPVANGVLVRFRITLGPNAGDQGSTFTNSNGRASFTYIGNGGVGTDLVLVWADHDSDGTIDAGEPQGTAIRSWTQVAGSAFSLSPTNDTNPANTRHSMAATFAPAQRDLLVRFEVTAGPNAGTRGSDNTNSSGRADLSYIGDEGVGTDVILAWVDFDRDGRIDAGEPQAIATTVWTTAVVSALTLSPEFDQEHVGKDHKVTARLSPNLSGVLVRFEVIAGPNQGETDQRRTDSKGRATFKYRGDNGVGTDVILAWADIDEDGILDPGEHQASALVEWQPGSDDNSRVAEVCNNLHLYPHPSLPMLCSVIESGHVSGRSRDAIIDVILKQAGFDHRHGWRGGHDDHDDDD